MLLHCRKPFASCMDTENLCAAESITVWQLCLLAGGGYSFSVYFSMSPVDFNSSVCFHTSFYHLCEKWRYVFSGCITNLEQKFLAKQSLQRYISINCIYFLFFFNGTSMTWSCFCWIFLWSLNVLVQQFAKYILYSYVTPSVQYLVTLNISAAP